MTHICTCLGFVNRGIICRHFFQIMLCSDMALKKQDHTVIEKLQNILEESATTDEEDEEDEDNEEDEENEEHEEDDNDEAPFDLQNPQRKPKRGRPKSTKRIKSSTEVSKKKPKMSHL
ncbi:hypothetical protein C2G38_2051456 [Gigaspora rosea]|uniref:SWIM-type domain-containing protein n=1 Tax=Gigaspora rosea TaxID=44941 RepID=A0A397TVG0_9GLOM|nr:hypothetical protein C2G38_2051456 [Gigaspora rosea]